MLKIELSAEQIFELMTLLGAAEGLFHHLATEHTGVAKNTFEDHATAAGRFIKNISNQHNKQVA